MVKSESGVGRVEPDDMDYIRHNLIRFLSAAVISFQLTSVYAFVCKW